MGSRSENQWLTWRTPSTTHQTTTMAMSLSLIGPEPSRRIRRRRQHRRVRQELQRSRTLSPVTSTIPITLPKSYALARMRFSKFRTCWRMSKMSSPRRHNWGLPEDVEYGESSPAVDTGVDPLEVCTEEAGEEPCGANESVTPVAVPAIPAYHATPTTSAAPHFSYTSTEHMSGATAMPPEPLNIADCFHSLAHVTDSVEVLRRCGCDLLISGDVQRTADRRMIGRFKITFAGRTLRRQHASCIRIAKILAQVGVTAKWLMAGLEQSEQEHYRNGFVVRRAIRGGSIAAPSHRTA